MWGEFRSGRWWAAVRARLRAFSLRGGRARALEQQQLHASQMNVTATLAGALISAAGRPHSVEETVGLMRDLHYALFPQTGSGSYEQWRNEARLDQRHV